MIQGLKPSDIPPSTVRAAFERAIEHRCTVQVWRETALFPTGTFDYYSVVTFTLDWREAMRPELAGVVYYLGGS